MKTETVAPAQEEHASSEGLPLPIVNLGKTAHSYDKRSTGDHIKIIAQLLARVGIHRPIEVLPGKSMQVPCGPNTPVIAVKPLGTTCGYELTVRPPGSGNNNRLSFDFTLPVQYRSEVDLFRLRKAAKDLSTEFVTPGRKSSKSKQEGANDQEAREAIGPTVEQVAISLGTDTRASWVSRTEVVTALAEQFPKFKREQIATIVDERFDSKPCTATFERLHHGGEQWLRLKKMGNVKSIPVNWIEILQSLIDISLEGGVEKIEPIQVARHCEFKVNTTGIESIMRGLRKDGLIDELNHPTQTEVYAYNGNLAAGKIHRFRIGSHDEQVSKKNIPSVSLDGYRILLAYLPDFRKIEPDFYQINCHKPIHRIIATDTNRPMGEGYLRSELAKLLEIGVLEPGVAGSASYKLTHSPIVVGLEEEERILDNDTLDASILKAQGVERYYAAKQEVESNPVPSEANAPSAEPSQNPFESMAKLLEGMGDMGEIKKKHEQQIASANLILQECTNQRTARTNRLNEINKEIQRLESERKALQETEDETEEKAIEAQASLEEATTFATPEYKVLKALLSIKS